MSNGATDLYGGFDLQRGDRDPKPGRAPVWGGKPLSGEEQHVAALQENLRQLGFHLVGGVDGGFGRRTEAAVREFQIYARMTRVAREQPAPPGRRYAERLVPVMTRSQPYEGPVSGVVNAATRAVLAHWLEKDWRCPVVIEAWNMRAGRRDSLDSGNIWLHDDVAKSAPRMYALDLSGYYGAPPAERLDDNLVVLGDFQKYLAWSGPRSVPPKHTWPEGELLPEALVGKPLGELSAAQRSTFKVVRAVSEVECLGYFDSVNSYDNAFVSQGPCHWTLGIVDSAGAFSDGELCGFLAYLRHADPDAFESALGFFGVRPDRDWVDSSGRPTGARLFLRSQVKYAGWLEAQQEDGGFAGVEKAEVAGDLFKTWHWFYRFVMAGRAVEGYRRAMWDMARIRLRDLRSVPWGSGVASVQTGTGPRLPRLGDIFTSERAMGILLRWHVRFPADVVKGGKAGSKMRGALQRARSAREGLTGDPSQWGDAEEKALVQALRDQVAARGNENLSTTIGQVDGWPDWAQGSNPRRYALDPEIGRLSEKRNSFQFDDAGLPPAP